MPVRYDQDTKAKASGLVGEHAGDYPSEYAAITAVAGRLEMTPETLRKWIRQAAVDDGQAPGDHEGLTGDPRAQAQGADGNLQRRRVPAGAAGPVGHVRRPSIPAPEVSCTRPAAGRAGLILGSMSWVMTHE